MLSSIDYLSAAYVSVYDMRYHLVSYHNTGQLWTETQTTNGIYPDNIPYPTTKSRNRSAYPVSIQLKSSSTSYSVKPPTDRRHYHCRAIGISPARSQPSCAPIGSYPGRQSDADAGPQMMCDDIKTTQYDHVFFISSNLVLDLDFTPVYAQLTPTCEVEVKFKQSNSNSNSMLMLMLIYSSSCCHLVLLWNLNASGRDPSVRPTGLLYLRSTIRPTCCSAGGNVS